MSPRGSQGMEGGADLEKEDIIMLAKSGSRQLAFIALGLLVLAACGEVAVEGPQPPDPLTEEEAARAVDMGGPAADALAGGLVGRLTQVMDQDGAAAALEFCSEEALVLTAGIQTDHDERLALKRTTLRWRNPANAPDTWEERVLEYLHALERQDPESVPSELTAAGPEGTLRYYRVLRTAPMCLNCHGDIPALDRHVRDQIRTLYPNDRATGYQAGDLRGVIRVEIPSGVSEP